MKMNHLLVTVVAELDSNVLVTLTIASDQFAQTQSAKLTRGHSVRKANYKLVNICGVGSVTLMQGSLQAA